MAGVADQELESFMRAEGGMDTAVAQTEVANETKDSAAGKKRKNGADQEANKKPKVQENRAIYITNLPRDATEQEIEDTFKKYGIIDQGADGNKRIKMYTDDKEQFNGEALIVYFKKDSIHLAIQMMDDYWFRPEDQKAGKISVKEADFSYKKEKDGEKAAAKLTRKDKKASERNRADMQRKLAEWSDDEEEVVKATYTAPKSKWEKVVIVKHAFTLEELDTDKDAYFEIKDDMREEAEKFGAVTNVTLFDKEEDGIITIRFKEFEAAEKFREKCNGRKFSHVPLEISIAEERPKFRKSGRGEDPDSDEEERLAAVVQG